MAKFLGFRQVSLSAFTAMTDAEKYNHMWLVREVVSGETKSAAIYFGTRLYAEINSDAQEEKDIKRLQEVVGNLLDSLGDSIDENGEFVGFKPLVDHEILSASTDFTEAVEALESAILADKAAAEKAIKELSANTEDAIADLRADAEASAATLDNKIEKLDDKVDEFSAATVAAIAELSSASTKELNELSAATMAEVERLDEKVDELSAGTEASISETKKELEKEITSAVTKAISDVISGAPEAFDTLKEIADWIQKHGASAETVFEQVYKNVADIATLSAKSEADKAELEKEIKELSAATVAAIEALDDKVDEFSADTVAEVARLDDKIDNFSAETVAELAELEAENEALKTRVSDLETAAEVDDRIHTIFGDDVEEIADTNAYTQAIINDAIENGGTVQLPDDTTYNDTLTI